MSWTPTEGMVLKHKTIPQKIVLGARKEVGSMTFWSVSEHDKYGKPIPWMIGEKNLVDQYDPMEDRR